MHSLGHQTCPSSRFHNKDYNQKLERFNNDEWVNSLEVTILNSSVSDNKTSKYMKQKLIVLQGEKDKPTVVVGNFNTTFSDNDRINIQKMTEDVAEFSDTINQLDLMAICRIHIIKYINNIYQDVSCSEQICSLTTME